MKVHFSSHRQNWKTPRRFYEELHKKFNFDFDPCPGGSVEFGRSGLSIEWGSRTFVNPPYSEIHKWMAKVYIEAQKGKTIVALVPSRTDTRWWHDYCMKADEIRFIKGRLCFDDGGGRAPFPSALVIWMEHHRPWPVD